MKDLFQDICTLIEQRQVRLSAHGHVRLTKRSILFAEVIFGAQAGEPIESYPEYFVGPAVLVLQADRQARPIHVVWGIERGTDGPAVLITAYYPDPDEWSSDFRIRK